MHDPGLRNAYGDDPMLAVDFFLFFFQTKNKNMLLISLRWTVGTLPLRLKQGKHSRALGLPNSGIRHACFLAMPAKCRAFICLLGTISSRWMEGTNDERWTAT
jgi:hypothetical protein